MPTPASNLVLTDIRMQVIDGLEAPLDTPARRNDRKPRGVRDGFEMRRSHLLGRVEPERIERTAASIQDFEFDEALAELNAPDNIVG